MEAWEDSAALAMSRKQKGLAMNCDNLSNVYLIETKTVSLSSGAKVAEKRGVPQQNLWVDCGSGRAPRVW